MIDFQPISVEFQTDSELLNKLCDDASVFAQVQEKIERGLDVSNNEMDFCIKFHGSFCRELVKVARQVAKYGLGEKVSDKVIVGLHRNAELYVLQKYQQIESVRGVYCGVRLDKNIDSAGVYRGGEIKIKDLNSLTCLSHEESHAMFDLWMRFLYKNRNLGLQLGLIGEAELLNNSSKIKDRVRSVIGNENHELENEMDAIEGIAISLAIVYAKDELIASMTPGHEVHSHRVSVKNLKGGGHYRYLDDWIGITNKKVLERTKLKYQEKLNFMTRSLIVVDNFYNQDRFVESNEVIVGGRRVAKAESGLWDGRKNEVRWLMMMLPIEEWNKIRETRYWKEMEEYKKFESYVGLFDQYKDGDRNNIWEVVQKIKGRVDEVVRNGHGDEVLAAIMAGINDMERYEY